MELESKNYIIQQDLENISKNIDLKELKNKTILITGSTGLIGTELVKSLLCYSRLNNINLNIIGLARNKEKINIIYNSLLNRKNLKFYISDIAEEINIDDNIDYIIHTASITSSKDFVEFPVETINTCLKGTINILELAKSKKVKSLVYLSSMEVYGVTDFNISNVTEKDYGYINPLDVRSSYSEGKRMAECICNSYKKEFGVNVKIARLVQTFGAGVNYNDNRVFAQFARAIIEKQDIVLHTKGETLRSYCYISDAVEAIFYILLKGNNGEAYNVANKETEITIVDMAKLLVENYENVNLKFEINDNEKYGYNPIIKLRLDVNKIETLGWKAKINLLNSYERMINSMIIDKEL